MTVSGAAILIRESKTRDPHPIDVVVSEEAVADQEVES